MTSGDADQNLLGVTVTSVYGYHEKIGRRFLRTPGAQRLPRRLQVAALDHTADLDIHNATKIIARHLVNTMGIVGCDVFKTELATLDKIVKDRDGTIETDLGVSCAYGKQLLLHSCSGKRIPEEVSKNTCLHSVQRLGIFLRSFACTSPLDVFAVAQSDRRKAGANSEDGDSKWLEAPAFATWWQRAEDHILKTWQLYVVQHPLLRLSLHF